MAEYLKELNKVCGLYSNVNPSKDSWIGGATGTSGISFNSVATRDYIRIELYINTGVKENNKKVFDAISKSKAQIESQFTEPLIWERLDDKVTARVKCELMGVSIFNEEDWEKMISFMVKVVPKFEAAFKKPIQELSRK